MSINERRKGASRVKFERPLNARAVTIDGTWCHDCWLIDVSETGARIELMNPASELKEFFLLLTIFGTPVFRRCVRKWVDGLLMGVAFEKGEVEGKPLERLRHEAQLV